MEADSAISGKDSLRPLRQLLRTLSRSWIALPVLVLALGAGVGLLVTELTRDDDSTASVTTVKPVTAAPTRDPAQRSFLSNVIPAPSGSISGQAPPRAIARLVRTMPLERKIAQLMLVGFSGSSPAGPVIGSLKRYDWGGLVVGSDNYAGRGQLLALTNAIKDQVARVKHVQPLLMAVQQGGDFSALPGLPPGDAPADVSSVEDAAQLAGLTGRTLRRLGLNAILAPSLEVAPSDQGAMGARAFSDDPLDVAAYASATVPAYAKAGVLAAAGRFPGLGAAQQAPEDGPANVGLTLDELKARDIVPFRAAIRAGVPAIVVGSGLYTTDDFVVPASSSHTLVSSLLRGQLGFRGLVLSDDLTEPAITSTEKTPDAAVGAIGAGVDMVYVSGDDGAIKDSYDALLAAAKSGKLGQARIDDALTHVLVAKASYGLLKPRKVARKPNTPGS